ncbi:transporter substrate-binding domain-containing protein [Burkholderia cepacia]|uniref:transporter substrate-binding domain-containing protein n=1 Tax=Burkholderia cepacia TaxID=292 RepID=UPI0029906950|nr:transporter substrate-binding domain-containing protein [Burkholderia cepacia]
MKSEGTIRIANTQTSPPWSALDNNNQPAGYDVDVAREVAKRMGLKVVFVGDSWNNFVQGLKSGKYDLVMCDLTPTSERAKQVDFSVPYGVEDFRIWVNEKNSTVRSPSDLAGKKVGVVTGTSNEVWSRSHLKNSIFVDYDNDGLLFSDLANGRIDATIQSHFGGLAQRDSNHLPVKEVGEPLTFQLSAAAMNKGNSALQNSVNRAVSEMLADGTIDRLGKKWVGSNYQMARYIKKAEEERN